MASTPPLASDGAAPRQEDEVDGTDPNDPFAAIKEHPGLLTRPLLTCSFRGAGEPFQVEGVHADVEVRTSRGALLQVPPKALWLAMRVLRDSHTTHEVPVDHVAFADIFRAMGLKPSILAYVWPLLEEVRFIELERGGCPRARRTDVGPRHRRLVIALRQVTALVERGIIAESGEAFEFVRKRMRVDAPSAPSPSHREIRKRGIDDASIDERIAELEQRAQLARPADNSRPALLDGSCPDAGPNYGQRRRLMLEACSLCAAVEGILEQGVWRCRNCGAGPVAVEEYRRR